MIDRRAIALSLWVVTMVAAVLAIVLVGVTRDTPVPTSWGFRGAAEAFGITCGTVGVIVALRRPENRIGWLFGIIGLGFALEAFVNEYVIASTFVVTGGLPATEFLAWTLTWLWVPALGTALIVLPLLFPTGYLLSRSWRLAMVFGVGAIIVFGVAIALAPGPIQQATFITNPLAIEGMSVSDYANQVVGPIWLPLILALGISLSSLVLRFRRASVETRQQIKWFALATLIAGAAFALYVTVSVIAPTADLKVLEILVIASQLGIPAAAGMAILRYRLYDIDRIISRTISYAVVTAVLFGTFVVINLALQNIITGLTGNESALAVAVSTLVVAVLFTPLRTRVKATVDRRFHRARYDAERTSLAFAERLRGQVDLPTLGRELDDTVQAVIAPSSFSLWLREDRR